MSSISSCSSRNYCQIKPRSFSFIKTLPDLLCTKGLDTATLQYFDYPESLLCLNKTIHNTLADNANNKAVLQQRIIGCEHEFKEAPIAKNEYGGITKYQQEVSEIVLLDNGNYFSSISNDALIKIWDIAKKQCIYTFDPKSKASINEYIYPDFSFYKLDEKYVASKFTYANTFDPNIEFDECDWVTEVRIWNCNSGQIVFSHDFIHGSNEDFLDIKLLSNKKVACRVDFEGVEIQIGNLETKMKEIPLTENNHSIFFSLFDGRFVSGANLSEEPDAIKIWGPRGECALTFPGHTGFEKGCFDVNKFHTFSISGFAQLCKNYLISYEASWYGSLKIWSLDSAQCVRTLFYFKNYEDEIENKDFCKPIFLPDNKVAAISYSETHWQKIESIGIEAFKKQFLNFNRSFYPSTIQVWNLINKEKDAVFTAKKSYHFISLLHLGGNLLAACSESYSIKENINYIHHLVQTYNLLTGKVEDISTFDSKVALGKHIDIIGFSSTQSNHVSFSFRCRNLIHYYADLSYDSSHKDEYYLEINLNIQTKKIMYGKWIKENPLCSKTRAVFPNEIHIAPNNEQPQKIEIKDSKIGKNLITLLNSSDGIKQLIKVKNNKFITLAGKNEIKLWNWQKYKFNILK